MKQDNDRLNKADLNRTDSQPKNEPQEPLKEAEAKEAAQKDYDSLWDRYVRLQADFDNYRKRCQREQLEFIKFANEGLILELLDILDNFDRGIKAADQKKDFALLHQGVDMISRQLHALLEEKGLKRLKTVGEKFDPHHHEALEVVEDETRQTDTIVEELQSGYLLNGRVIRPAKVKVVRKPDHRPQTTDHGLEEKKEKKKEKNTGLAEA